INESIIVKYRSFAGQANPVRLRMTKMWGLHSNDKKREKCFFTQSDGSLFVQRTVPPVCLIFQQTKTATTNLL
ncbi:MAG: hypothetical protein GX925_01130, partial [Clostridiales bacterium]|nr:hypothetical protein [Clostridiales bacterium]